MPCMPIRSQHGTGTKAVIDNVHGVDEKCCEESYQLLESMVHKVNDLGSDLMDLYNLVSDIDNN